MNATGLRRRVPWGFRLEALFGGRAVLGWVILALAMHPFLIPNAYYIMSLIHFSGKLRTTTGVVSEVSDTGEREGKSGPNIFSIDYTFTTPDGSLHTGKSYCIGDENYDYNPAVQRAFGDNEIVEYLPGQPDISRIRGMRANPHDNLFDLFLTIIVVIFAGWLAIARFREGLLAIRLVKCGKYAQARLTDSVVNYRRPSNYADLLEENQKRFTSYTVTFAYIAQDGSSKTIKKTFFSQVKPEWLTYHSVLHDGKALIPVPEETVIYDPNHPNRQVLLSHLSFNFTLNDDGNIAGDSLSRGIMCCIPPTICLIVALLYLL